MRSSKTYKFLCKRSGSSDISEIEFDTKPSFKKLVSCIVSRFDCGISQFAFVEDAHQKVTPSNVVSITDNVELSDAIDAAEKSAINILLILK